MNAGHIYAPLFFTLEIKTLERFALKAILGKVEDILHFMCLLIKHRSKDHTLSRLRSARNVLNHHTRILHRLTAEY
jgi:hypothetical protein